MAQQARWNMLEDRGFLPKESGHQLREQRAMHEEKITTVGCVRMWK